MKLHGFQRTISILLAFAMLLGVAVTAQAIPQDEPASAQEVVETTTVPDVLEETTAAPDTTAAEETTAAAPDTAAAEEPMTAPETSEETVAATAAPTEPAAVQAAPQAATCAPIVWVGGGFHELYLNAGTPEQVIGGAEGGAESFFTGMGSKVSGAGDQFLALFKKLDFKGIADLIAKGTRDLFGILSFDPNGNSIYDLAGDENSNNRNLAKCELNPESGAYEFFYLQDWRLDPMEGAAKLHEYIEKVKQRVTEVSGVPCEKVNLRVQSGSGPWALAYLYKYDTDDLEGLFLRASFHKGTGFFGAIVTGKLVSPNSEALLNFSMLSGLLENETFAKYMPALKWIAKSGKFIPLSGILYFLIDKLVFKRLYETALVPVLLTIPGFWSWVPEEDYAKGIQFCFGKERAKYAGLIEKLDFYHNKVMVNADKLLLDASKKIRVGLLSGFGDTNIPVGPIASLQADGMVETHLSSLGAKTSYVGDILRGQLGKPYAQKNNDGHDHISPDKTVDASTAKLPETTWFTAGLGHGDDGYLDFQRWFFSSVEAPTVFSNPQYPQFFWRRRDDAARGAGTVTEDGVVVYDNIVQLSKPPAIPELSTGEKVLDGMARLSRTLMHLLFWYLP